MGDLFQESLRIRAKTEQARLDFIRTDLGVCMTFATVAETAYRMGRREHAERTIASAEKGYSDMLRYFSHVKGMTPEVEEELQQSKFKQLRATFHHDEPPTYRRGHAAAGCSVPIQWRGLVLLLCWLRGGVQF